MAVKIVGDPVKSARNEAERGLPFAKAAEFDWGNARYAEDLRKDYPERRFIALGLLGGRLHVICFTPIPRRGADHQFAQGQHAGGSPL